MEELEIWEQFFLDYIEKNGKIINVDMVEIQKKHKINIPQQMNMLKQLAQDRKVEDRSVNWWEPQFYLVNEDHKEIDESIDSSYRFRTRNISQRILQYISVSEGNYDSIELFMDFGISLDTQKIYIEKLLDDNLIEEYRKGYRIKNA